jgi:Tol biopolymer transport system component
MKTFRRMSRSAKLSLGLVAAVCVLGAGASTLWAAGPHYGGWSTPVNLGPTINTSVTESGAAISKDGLSLYFYSPRAGGIGGNDIYVAQRESVDDAWGTPANLGPTVNSTADDSVPSFSRDGHWMFFASTRTGGFGMADLYQSYRPNVHDDFGWETPTNLGPNVNTAANENGNGYFENDDGGAPQLYFGSDRPGGLGNTDIYVTERQPDGTWGTPSPVTELSSNAADNRPSLRHDGLEIFFYSARAGGGGTDVWTATRDSVDAPWSTPVNLGAPVDTSFTDIHPYVSPDGATLYFSSNRTGAIGGLDLYVSTRSKTNDGHG